MLAAIMMVLEWLSMEDGDPSSYLFFFCFFFKNFPSSVIMLLNFFFLNILMLYLIEKER
jgi:hypothetical protein